MTPSWRAAAAIGVGLLLLAVHMWVAVAQAGPVAVPDVPGYLSFAQWTAGGQPPPPFGYHPGYGLLLAPVALAGASPFGLLTAALVLNGALAVAGFFLALALLDRLAPHAGRWQQIVVALVAALHPSLSVSSRIAWPETALVVIVLGAAVLAADAAKYPNTWRFAAVGAISGAGVVLHPRAAALAVGAGAAVFLFTLLARAGWRPILAFTAGLGFVAAATWAVLVWAYTGPSSPGRLTDLAETGARGAGVLGVVAGQLVALAAGTVGLALVGLVSTLTIVARFLFRRSSVSIPPGSGMVAVLLGVGAIVTILFAGASLAGSDRADVLAYGRYLDPYSIALATFAVGSGALIRVRGLVVSLTILIAAVAVTALSAGAVTRPGLRIMTLANDPWWVLSQGRLPGALAGMAVVAALGIGATVVMAWRSGPGLGSSDHRAAQALGLLVAVVLGTATVTGQQHVAAVGQVAAGQVTAAPVFDQEYRTADHAVACLAHDRHDVPSYALWLYRWALPDVTHRRVSLSHGERPCSELVIASTRTEEIAACPNARLLHDEPQAHWGLWRIDSRTCSGEFQTK